MARVTRPSGSRPNEWPRRLSFVMAFFFMAGAVLVARLVKIQIVDHSHLSELAEAHQFRRAELRPTRGRILAADEQVLAFTSDNVSIYARREEITDIDAVVAALDSLGLDARRARKRLRPERGFVWLCRSLLPETRVQEVVGRLDGLYARREAKRVRPRGELADLVVGAWSDDEDLHSGVERRFDEALAGECGWETVVLDALGNRYATPERREPTNGRDVLLTLDPRIQEAAELVLDRVMSKWRARGASAVILDPSTGDVLAMASAERGGKGSRNRPLMDAVEVGSCAKVVVAAAALEEDLCDTTTAFYCGARPDEDERMWVSDDHGEARWLSLRSIIVQSRNTGTARVARLVGEERLREYLVRFGFGTRSGIDLPGESAGFVRPLAEWSGRSLESVAIGYEFSTTALQLATAYGAVANGGELLRPRLVRGLRDPLTGRASERPREVVRRVMSEETAAKLRAVFQGVTEPGGTGTRARLPWTSVAGKTGTARKYDPSIKTYSAKRHVASFVGFVPADAPRFVCAVVVDEPKGGMYGGEVAAPAFREIMMAVAALEPGKLRNDVTMLASTEPPRPQKSGEAWAGPPMGSPTRSADFRGYATEAARHHAARLGVPVEVFGTGPRVLHQSPVTNGRTMTISLSTANEVPESVPVPDVRGLGLRRAMARLAEWGFAADRAGIGRVVSQHPAPGEPLESGQVVKLILKDVERVWERATKR